MDLGSFHLLVDSDNLTITSSRADSISHHTAYSHTNPTLDNNEFLLPRVTTNTNPPRKYYTNSSSMPPQSITLWKRPPLSRRPLCFFVLRSGNFCKKKCSDNFSLFEKCSDLDAQTQMKSKKVLSYRCSDLLKIKEVLSSNCSARAQISKKCSYLKFRIYQFSKRFIVHSAR